MEMFEEPTPVAPVRDLLPEKLSGEQLSALLPKIPAIKAILKFLEEEAVRRLANGLEDAPADYKLVRGTSRRRWRTDIPQAELVQALIDKGIEPWQKKMTTLTEVETLHGKGSIDDLLEKPEPAPRLVPCTAKGVAWSPTDAALAAFDAEDDSDD